MTWPKLNFSALVLFANELKFIATYGTYITKGNFNCRIHAHQAVLINGQAPGQYFNCRKGIRLF